MSKNTTWTIDTPHPEEAPKLVALQADYWRTHYAVADDQPDTAALNADIAPFIAAMESRERIALREQYIARIVQNKEAFYKVARDDNDAVVGLLFGTKQGDRQHIAALYGSDTDALKHLVRVFQETTDPELRITAAVFEHDAFLQKIYSETGFVPIPESVKPYQDSHFLKELTMTTYHASKGPAR